MFSLYVGPLADIISVFPFTIYAINEKMLPLEVGRKEAHRMKMTSPIDQPTPSLYTRDRMLKFPIYVAPLKGYIVF
jgi:hypothetical protein